MLFLENILDIKKNFLGRKKSWGEIRIFLVMDEAQKALKFPVDLDKAEKYITRANDLYKENKYNDPEINKRLTKLTISYAQKIN